MATWRKLLTAELERHEETITDIESTTLTWTSMDAEFDDEWGTGVKSCPFTAWTESRVYFPAQDNDEESGKCFVWVASVPRHPNGEAVCHIGVV